ncbi:hypothetical protein P4O66_009229 [Electrophorus voltai]|uniref:Uncharacterized protein n=1 Tax=Electrophorus voltai TaxID=2609070 RepID=A0AAD8ZBV3_9TELE|nr:hypothetical protein P4O66_009229 [Electrophorus voltai]
MAGPSKQNNRHVAAELPVKTNRADESTAALERLISGQMPELSACGSAHQPPAKLRPFSCSDATGHPRPVGFWPFPHNTRASNCATVFVSAPSALPSVQTPPPDFSTLPVVALNHSTLTGSGAGMCVAGVVGGERLAEGVCVKAGA